MAQRSLLTYLAETVGSGSVRDLVSKATVVGDGLGGKNAYFGSRRTWIEIP